MEERASRGVGVRALAALATPMAIRVAATLRLADHVAGGRTTAADLADAVGAHERSLARLLGHLVSVGLFIQQGTGDYALTDLGEQLREDHHRGRRRWLDINGAVGRGDLSFVHLLHSVETGDAAYPLHYGTPFWDDLRSDPALWTSFDDSMEHHVAHDGMAVAEAYDWGSLGHVVDVGGGNGALLGVLMSRHPELRGTVVDLPGPAAAARAHFRAKGLTSRARVVEGDFFAPLPSGAGGYVLSSVLHDWGDDEAVRILRRCADAAGDKGSVLVVEAVGRDGESPSTAMDLRMLIFTGGRERGLTELGRLADRAGLEVRTTRSAGFLAVIELVRQRTRPADPDRNRARSIGTMTTETTRTTPGEGDRAALADVPRRMMDAWAGNDADAFAALFTDDATMVLPGEDLRSSKNEIRAFMAAQYAGPLKGTSVFGTPLSVRVLDDDNAVLITRGGVVLPGSNTVAPEREIQATWVLRRENDEWFITAYHNSPLRVS